MNQLPVNPVDRNVVDRTVRRRRESAGALDLSMAARSRRRARCLLLDRRGASRESASPVPLRRAS